MSLEYLFYNDYSEGAHPKVLKALNESNALQDVGYGEDTFTQNAVGLIRARVDNPQAGVHFVSGGTQANLIVLASMMKPYEAVIAAKTAHINVHEAGAIEATGHKVLTVESPDGKVRPEQIVEQVKYHSDEHMVKPKVIFISNATELGTVYSKKELADLSEVSRTNGLYLYMDGARLGAGLTAKDADLTLPDIARLTDAFYIGGTKNGALFGEAIVINNPALQEDFRYYLKQHGALLAKGRILAIQFTALFKDNLYFKLAQHANEMAGLLSEGITKLGYDFLTDSPTNQIFPILPNKVIEELEKKYGFYVWSKVDSAKSAIRLVTSFATPKAAVEKFLNSLSLN